MWLRCWSSLITALPTQTHFNANYQKKYMSSNNAASFHEKVERHLDNLSLHSAFLLLKRRIAEINDPRISSRLNNLEDTYKYMIHYLVEGFTDSGRDVMLADIVAQLRFVNDYIKRHDTMIDSPDIYSSTKRFENIRKATLEGRIADYREALSKMQLAQAADAPADYAKHYDDALVALFSYVWTMFGASPDEYKTVVNLISEDGVPFDVKAQLISALLLGNLSYYDRNALFSLIDIYEADLSQRLSARAMVAIMLIVAANPHRVKNDNTIKQRLSLWQDSIITYRRLREVLMNIIRSRDTQRISSKMQNEVLPELMKLRPEIINKLKNITADADLETLDTNPEWENILNKNGLGDKLKELTEMQLEGGDVMMVAFSNLKAFPFFNTVANWFLPFSTQHSEVISQVSNGFDSFSEILDAEGVMCDSDKFSFAFSLSRMPEQQRKMMTEQMNSQMAQLKEALADKKLKSSVPEFDTEVTRYVRDIYRFFKLYRRKDDFPDPFAKPLDFRSLPFISNILTDSEILNLVGEFYFKRQYYAEALPILELLSRENPEDFLLWEKIGYCHHAIRNLEKAVEWYSKAELLDPDSKWLIRKLAVCYRLLNRFKEASEYYAKALASDPDNYQLLMSAGNCLLESGNVADALASYYHAEYIMPDKLATRRAIAWTEFLNGNMEKSMAYYKRILNSGESSAEDWLNAGHVNFVAGNLKETLRCYKKAISFDGFDINHLEKSIADDSKVINDNGGNPQDLLLLIDKIKYEQNE